MLIKETDSLGDIWATIKHELHRAALDNHHPFRFVTMATLSADRPDSRYVVLRKLDEDMCFHIYTDSRSHKVKQLNENPAVALLFYHPQQRCQVKVQGKATVHHQDTHSQKHWKYVQGESQKAYQAIASPGTPVAHPTAAHVWEKEKEDTYFSVLAIQPISIECLQLDGLRHLRNVFFKDGENWNGKWLAP